MFDLITTQILLEFKKTSSRRASACVLPVSNNVSNENNSNHKLGKQKNINNNNKINSISKDNNNKMISLEDKSKTNNSNMNAISENTESSNNNTESRDDLTKLQDRKTSNKTENNNNSSNKPKLRSTPSWVECQKNKENLGLHYNSNTPDDDDETMMDRIQIVRVEEIMDRLKVFRENVTSIIEDNKSRWQEQKDRDEQIMNAAQS